MTTSVALNDRSIARPPGSTDSAGSAPDPPRGGAVELVNRRSDALLAFVSQGVSSLTNFLRLVFVARLCSEETVGIYSLGFTVVLLMAGLSERLIDAPYTVFAYRREGESRRKLLGGALTFCLLAVGVGAAATLAVGGVSWAAWPDSSLGVTLVAAAAILPPVILREFARGVSFTHFRMRSAIMIDVVTLLLQAAVLAAVWRMGVVGLFTIYAAIGVSCVVPVIVWGWAWRSDWRLDFQSMPADWRESWDFSRWLVAARVMGNGSRIIIPWIVFALIGEAAAGRLAVCTGLVGLAWLFVRGLNNFFRPYIVQSFSEGGAAAARRAVMLTALTPTAALAPIALLFVLAGDSLLGLIYGEAFRGVESVVVILTINTVAVCWAAAAATGLLAIDLPRTNLWIEGLTLAGTLVATPLILIAGLNGAAAAMLVGNLCGVVCAFWMFQQGLRALAPAREVAA